MILCKASEVGKIVVNKCLARGIFLNTVKLEKLLVLMQLECLERSKKPLFTEDIVVFKGVGVVIPQVDRDFLVNAVEFTEEQTSYIVLLDKEKESIEYVLERYGHMDSFELESLYAIKKLDDLSIERNGKRVIPAFLLKAQYL